MRLLALLCVSHGCPTGDPAFPGREAGWEKRANNQRRRGCAGLGFLSLIIRLLRIIML